MDLAELLEYGLASVGPATERVDVLPIFGRVLRGVLEIMLVERSVERLYYSAHFLLLIAHSS